MTLATFLVRLVFPFDSQKYAALNLYQWPECVALFALGVMASGKGWLAAVPDRLRGQSRNATLAAVGGFAVFAGFGAALGVIDDQTWGGGWHVDAFMFAALESTLAVFGPVWLLAVAQRHLDRHLRWAGPVVSRSAYGAFLVVSRSAYGAFLVQGLVLIALAVALWPVAVPAELKAVIMAGGGVAGSFTLAWLLIRRVPGVSRIL